MAQLFSYMCTNHYQLIGLARADMAPSQEHGSITSQQSLSRRRPTEHFSAQLKYDCTCKLARCIDNYAPPPSERASGGMDDGKKLLLLRLLSNLHVTISQWKMTDVGQIDKRDWKLNLFATANFGSGRTLLLSKLGL